MENTSGKTLKELFDIFFSFPDEAGEFRYRSGRFYEFAGALGRCEENSPQCALLVNAIEREFSEGVFYQQFAGAVFDAIVDFGVLPQEMRDFERSPKVAFLIESAFELFNRMAEFFRRAGTLGTVIPDAAESLASQLEVKSTFELVSRLILADPFAGNRVFRWHDGVLLPVDPDAVKPVNKFFGFSGVRHIFTDHFSDFAGSKSNVPLLIYSLPGYGKTSMTLSHALAIENSVVILPEPEDLNGKWIELVNAISRRKDHKFVLFFDDIDPGNVDWYSFRTHVGGAFSMPDNVMPVMSSNYEFPAGILSRGRKLSYPVFDELRCTEMIEDFLLDFGLKRPMPQLVSLIGADYTEEFGQKKFTELSPRTLMRYLQIYMQDRNKRRTMVEMSMGEMVTRPDAELFYEFNINLMRDLYGEEYIVRLRNEKLKNL